MHGLHWELMSVVWAVAVSVTAAGTWLSLRHLRQSSLPAVRSSKDLPGVSILKPLRGMDDGIVANLESFFKLDYPAYEILFSVAAPSDPVCRVVLDLMAKFPETQARLLVGAVEVGLNPKVNNLIKSYDQASYDSIVISDSNVRVAPDYLSRLVSHFGEDVGMMTSIVAGINPLGWGGILEATFLNTFFARAMTVAAAIGQPCVMGKSMMFRRSVLQRVGGMRGLSEYLAEDYFAGEKVKKLGLRVLVLSEPIGQYIGQYSVSAFWSRHVRWGRLRKVQAPFLFLVELWTGCLISGVLGALALRHLYGVPVSVFAPLHLFFWAGCDMLLMHRMGQRPTLKSFCAWLLRESSHFLLWLHIAAGNSVEWRGQTIQLCLGGTIRRNGEALLPAVEALNLEEEAEEEDYASSFVA